MDTTNIDRLDMEVDIIGQRPVMRIYTQLSFIYPVTDSSDSAHAGFVRTLDSGLECLAATFPWVAGQIVCEDAREGFSGVYKIGPLDGKSPRLVVKDLRGDASAPTMASLRKSRFPVRMLHEDVIAPGPTLPGGPGYDADAPQRVLVLQLNFIHGGIILTAHAQHRAMDIIGQVEIMRLLSKACRGKPFTEEETAVGNLPHKDSVPLYDDVEKVRAELAPQTSQAPAKLPVADDKTPLASQWAFFSFSPAALKNLKAHATSTVNSSSGGFVSTDDALTALVWQAATRARLPRIDASVDVKMSRAVDIRRHVGKPAAYPGLLQNHNYYSYPSAQHLADAPLGHAAQQLRTKLDPAGVLHRARTLATALAREDDKGVKLFTPRMDISKDLIVSSWTKASERGCYEVDFGLGLGRPEAVRRPGFAPTPALVYYMPRTPEGEVTVMISLVEEDMERLREDGEFARYGEYIG